MTCKGHLVKLKTSLNDDVKYHLRFAESADSVEINSKVGSNIALRWTGDIRCAKCAKPISKTFGEGFCYDCFATAPESSPCIIRPELCEAHLGKGRDAKWEQLNHNQPHVVYLAQTDGIKVGITRENNLPSRWLDQGAWRAVVIAKVPYRRLAGEMEVELKQYLSDKTDWRKMLTNGQSEEDLVNTAEQMASFIPAKYASFLTDSFVVKEFKYPVISYPEKIQTVLLEKEIEVHGQLMGLRGQYLLMDQGRALNVRKYTGYEVELSFHP